MERLLFVVLLVHAFACQLVLAAGGDWLAAHLELGLAVFARSQIVATFVALGFVTLRRSGRWLGAIGAIIVVGFVADVVGLATGLPFGRYTFTDLLGPKIVNGVPVLIPLSWANVAVPSWAIAAALLPTSRAPARVVAGSLLMASWDLLVDPVMGSRYAYWIWAEKGVYYGIPASNFVGWLVVGVVMTSILEALAPRSRETRELRPLVALYGVGLFGPLGLVLVSRLWLAAVLAAPAIACCALARRRTRPAPLPLSRDIIEVRP